MQVLLAFVYKIDTTKREPPANHFAGGTQLITNFLLVVYVISYD